MLNLIPDRSALSAAARNALALSFFGDGIERHQPTPSAVIHDAHHRTLRRFGDDTGSAGNPVLLVPPLAVPADCYDLRPGQSLAEFLLEQGRTPYVVDYGDIGYSDRGLGFEDWIDDIVPGAVRRVSADAGGKPVDVVAWSLGGTLSLLTAAAHDDLPIRSVTTVGTPIDYDKNPAVIPLRLLTRLTGSQPLAAATHLMGGVPALVVQLGFRSTALHRELTKPWFIVRNLHDTETLARMSAVERFMGAMPGYPARLYSQMHERLVVANDLASGRVHLGTRVIELANLQVPVLAFGGSTDAIAPMACATPITEVLTGAPSVRFEAVPGSHLGLLAGPGARTGTWPHLEDFLTGLDIAGSASRLDLAEA